MPDADDDTVAGRNLYRIKLEAVLVITHTPYAPAVSVVVDKRAVDGIALNDMSGVEVLIDDEREAHERVGARDA